MLLRALSGAVYVAVIVLCVLYGPRWFTLLMGVFGVIGISEVVRMICRDARRFVAAEYVDLGFYALILLYPLFMANLGGDAFKIVTALAFIYLPLRMILAVMQRGDGALRQAVGAFFGFIYVGMPLLLANYCYSTVYVFAPDRAVTVMLLSFVLIWLNDTGAYLSGRTFGRTKLCERLSPKKTWEGFWGGFVLCIAASVVFAFCVGYNPLILGCYGALVSVASTYGDLFESLIKRRCGVKDSGTLIPGHGGILDRIDSYLAVAPIAALMLFVLY